MRKRIKIAATGLSGLVGSRVEELLRGKFDFISLNQQIFDITNKQNVSYILDNLEYDFFLHFAAYTQVDKAEIDKEICNAINVFGTQNIMNSVLKKNKKLIYISTGFVFDGKNPPFYENSLPNPVGYYGKTKYEGEQIVKNNGMIVRIDTPYRVNFSQKKDFIRTIKGLLEENKSLTMVTDSLITPTYIDDIALALEYLIHNYSQEIVHIVGADPISPYDAGQLIAKKFNLDSSLISAISFSEYSKNKALRPQFLDMKTNKNTFFKMKTFEEGLNRIKSTPQ